MPYNRLNDFDTGFGALAIGSTAAKVISSFRVRNSITINLNVSPSPSHLVETKRKIVRQFRSADHGTSIDKTQGLMENNVIRKCVTRFFTYENVVMFWRAPQHQQRSGICGSGSWQQAMCITLSIDKRVPTRRLLGQTISRTLWCEYSDQSPPPLTRDKGAMRRKTTRNRFECGQCTAVGRVCAPNEEDRHGGVKIYTRSYLRQQTTIIILS